MDWLRISGLEDNPLETRRAFASVYGHGLWATYDAGDSWARNEGPLGQLPAYCLDVVGVYSRTFVTIGVAGGTVTTSTLESLTALPALDSWQAYGSGIYLLTLARRHHGIQLYLPLILRQ